MNKTESGKHLTLDRCADILDWFSDPQYDYINHILIAKLDGERRLKRALPELSGYCLDLVIAHMGLEDAYPIEDLAA